MAYFDDFIAAKQKLKEAFLNNQTICDLLVNTGSNMAEYEHVRTGSKSPAASKIYTHFHVPGSTTTDTNFITMRGRVVRADSEVIKEILLTVYVVCNEDQNGLWQGSRADLIANEVDRIVNNGDPLYGYGGIELTTSEEVQFADGYIGWKIPYFTHEFNREAEHF